MKLKVIITALLCAALMLLTGCGITRLIPSLALPEKPQIAENGSSFSQSSEETIINDNMLVIWYTVENDFSGLLEELTAKYNAQGGITAELRAFDTEDELARALNYSRPDLLLCSSSIASGLWNNGNLVSLNTSAAFLPALCEQSESIGKGYFPFGITANVLLVNTALAAELMGGEIPAGLFSSLENIFALSADFPREDGAALISARSYADVFTAYMSAAGDEFTGLRENDLESDIYRGLYNLLAEGVYCDVLNVDSRRAAEDTASGRCVCAFVSTLDITYLPKNCTVLPMPEFMGVKPLSFGSADGLAVCCENPARYYAVTDYLGYIFSIDSSAAVEALGRVPAGEYGSYAFSRIGGSESIRILIPSVENELNISLFDDWFAKMLKLLY